MSQLTRQHIEAQQMVARYVADQLSSDDCDAFEDYCVAHPDVAEAVRQEERFRAGIKALPASITSNNASRRTPENIWRIAASVAFIGFVGLLASRWWPMRATSNAVMFASESSARAVLGGIASTRVRLAVMRGAALVLNLPTAPTLLSLNVDAGVGYQGKAIIAALQRTAADGLTSPIPGATVPVNVSSAGNAELFVDSTVLAPGTYVLQFSCRDCPADVPSEYRIRFETRRP